MTSSSRVEWGELGPMVTSFSKFASSAALYAFLILFTPEQNEHTQFTGLGATHWGRFEQRWTNWRKWVVQALDTKGAQVELTVKICEFTYPVLYK